MTALRLILLYGHFVGIALLFGGTLVQLPAAEPLVLPSMLRGAGIQLVTGIALVAVRHLDDLPTNDPKYAVKLGLTLVILGVLVSRRNTRVLTKAAYRAIVVLVAATLGVAVFWT
jgi:hypothetical protein